eukprot:INCI18817.1.p1 GENE.INCI18817.1~~INCI18817.1.p1  ORF type:complete len:372 (+),score=91.28 INCI18817.1:127-1116(+)
MSEARPLTDFLKSNDQYAKSRARFTENELASTVVKDVYEGLERYNCCYCGHFCAILNEKLEVLPKRSTDGSTAVAKKHVLKQRLAEGEKKRIKRPKGIETQYRMLCPGCNLFVAYRSTPKVSAAKYIYICEDSLTQKATVLHVEGSDELSTGVVSNTLVPKSVQNGREPETVRLVIRPQTGSDRSCVRKLNDEAVFIDLECPPGSEEEAVNAELRRYLCLVLDKASHEIELDVGGFEDGQDTVSVVVRGKANRFPIGQTLLAACSAGTKDDAEAQAGEKARAAVAAALADAEAATEVQGAHKQESVASASRKLSAQSDDEGAPQKRPRA